MREYVLQLQPVDHWKGPLQQRLRNLEPYEIVVLLRRITILCHLQGIESKLGFQVRRPVLRIANRIAIFSAQFRIVDGDSLVDRGVAVDVRRIVRKRTQGEGVLVGIPAFKQQLPDKVPAANIMHQVAEVLAAERVVA